MVTTNTTANRIAAKNSGGIAQVPTATLLRTLLYPQTRQINTSSRKSRSFKRYPFFAPNREAWSWQRHA